MQELWTRAEQAERERAETQRSNEQLQQELNTRQTQRFQQLQQELSAARELAQQAVRDKDSLQLPLDFARANPVAREPGPVPAAAVRAGVPTEVREACEV